MKLIDFDELEKLKDEDDDSSFDEDWDGGFFAEFADRVSEEAEEDEDAYLAVPVEVMDSKVQDIKDGDEESYVEIPTELKEQYTKELHQRELRAKAEEEHFVVEKEEEDIYELSEETEDIPLEEKRIRFGRMLGLRVGECVEPEVPVQSEPEEEPETLNEVEALEEAETLEVTEEKEEPVYYDPLEFSGENNEEYEKFREQYVKKYILHEEETDEEPENENTFMPEAESNQEDAYATEAEPNQEDAYATEAEPNQEDAYVTEAESEQNDNFVQKTEEDFTEEIKSEEESSFVDEREFYRIEQEELRRIQEKKGEITEEDDTETETDTETIKEAETGTEELKETDTEESDEIETDDEGPNDIKTDKKVLNIRDLPVSNSSGQTVSKGVLQKRTLANRIEKPVKAQQSEESVPEALKETGEKTNAEESEKYSVNPRAALGLSQGKKIRKLQSAFEDEYLDVMDFDMLERKGKQKHKKSPKRKDNKRAGIDWEEEDETPDKPFKEFFILMISIVIVVVATFVLVEFVGQRTEVNGESMESTLHDGDNLIVDKITYAFGEPQRFDIVVFPYTMVNSDKEVFYIKRIIGLPGERVQIINGFIYINGELLVESYGKNNNLILNPGRAEREIQLGEDEYFVLGDNRNNSSDSREIGNIKREDIVGRAWLRIWPLSDFGILKHQ